MNNNDVQFTMYYNNNTNNVTGFANAVTIRPDHDRLVNLSGLTSRIMY